MKLPKLPILFLIHIFMLIACSFIVGSPSIKEYYIILGKNASIIEKITANHFKIDLENATGLNVEIAPTSSSIPQKANVFVIGTKKSNPIIAQLSNIGEIELSEIFPGRRGGIWSVANYSDRNVIVLGGSDIQGTQYSVYEYCTEMLKVDPFSYWTGTKTKLIPDFEPFNFEEKVIPPPQVPILCYFENDVDELANLNEPLLEYDWKNYTEMINSLVRIKYNAIQLFDMLGRPEFFERSSYQKLRPSYDVKLDYIEKMIDYAHDMGMMVQIDMALGYKIKPMKQENADCWKENKEKWIETWKYYFEETPLGKADIFSLRPRNQVWDWEYKSSCGEDKTEVFNEVYFEFGKLVDKYVPNAIKVVICYDDGMEMFNEGFNPPKDFIVAWSDDGFGGFKTLPNETKGYNFGTYMHAGFWLNHTVHDPYPIKIDTVMKFMFKNYNADEYLQVNGQTFRPFLLNLEAFSDVANNPNFYNGEDFYSRWTNRYIKKTAAEFAVKSMKKLHEAQFKKGGYVENLWIIKSAIAYLSDSQIKLPDREPIPTSFTSVKDYIDDSQIRKELAKESINFAIEGRKYISGNNEFYHDFITLPANLFLDLVRFTNNLLDLSMLKKKYEDEGDPEIIHESLKILEETKKNLAMIYKRRMEGDKNQTWKGWYDPARRRPNNGFPKIDDLKRIKENFEKISKQN